MLLNNADEFSVYSRQDLSDIVETVASGHVLHADKLDGRAYFRCRSHVGKSLSLYYLTSRFSTTFEFEPVDYHRFVFQLERTVKVRTGSAEFSVDPGQAGYILQAGQSTQEAHPAGYRSLALRLDPEKLQLLASRLLGEPIDKVIAFEQPDSLNPRFMEFVRGSVVSVAREFSEITRPFLDAYWETFETNIAIRILLHGQHSLSHLFRQRAPRSDRVKRVEDFIHEHWDQPLHLDRLAEIAGTSAKTVCNDFIRRHHQTPHEYVKRLRLQKAHSMLLRDPTPSAMMVALKCGFVSFGNFARSYRLMFGELPSTTAKRPRV